MLTTCRSRIRQLRTDRLRQRVRHRPVRERPEQPPASIHREITGRPHRWGSHITREHRVVGRERIERPGDELRVNRFHTRRTGREIVESLARRAIVRQ